MSLLPSTSSNPAPTFSGHETFALRGNWLKKAYDLLQHTPDLFSREDAFVRLGVGKNMAQSIRYWGQVCNVFVRPQRDEQYRATRFGDALLAQNGWDPFLVTSTARWLLHWQVAARRQAAFTFFFAFNLIRVGDFSAASLAEQIQDYVAAHEYSAPSTTTLERDIDCFLHCYVRPTSKQVSQMSEDLLTCPLTDLGLLTALPGLNRYRLMKGPQPTLKDELVAWSTAALLRRLGRATITFGDLAYLPSSPGRVFRLDEDSLLAYLYRLEDVTHGAAVYTDHAGVRQVHWRAALDDPEATFWLLEQAFDPGNRRG